MKVIVCGGRDYRNAALLWKTLNAIHAGTPITQLMQGGATGADTLAREWAATKPEIRRWVCHADWQKHGAAAGPIRNAKMLEWNPDLVIAFPGGKGTANMIKQTKAANIKILEVKI